MSADRRNQNSVPPVTYVVDDAVGVGKSFWFIAIVNHNSEKIVAEKLAQMGVETYIPVQTEIRVWKNGRKSKVDKIIIPATVFIHCTEQKRREVVKLPFIYRFMTNNAGVSKDTVTKPIATVTDSEINQLKFMLGQSDIPVEIIPRTYRQGDRVKIIRGKLAGLEGDVVDMNSSQSKLTVSLGILGCAKLVIETINLELIQKG